MSKEELRERLHNTETYPYFRGNEAIIFESALINDFPCKDEDIKKVIAKNVISPLYQVLLEQKLIGQHQ